MCCVSQAWATSEQENRRTLWRALALARWPNLGLGLQIDWRQRYRVLLQNGKPANRDKLDDPLADYAFVLQGRWGAGGAGGASGAGGAGGSDELSPAFSGVVAARTYAATVSLHGNDLEFRDAFQIEIKLCTPVPLPKALSAWSNAPLCPPWAVPQCPQLGPCASSGRTSRLWVAQHSQVGGEPGHCAPKLPIPQPVYPTASDDPTGSADPGLATEERQSLRGAGYPPSHQPASSRCDGPGAAAQHGRGRPLPHLLGTARGGTRPAGGLHLVQPAGAFGGGGGHLSCAG